MPRVRRQDLPRDLWAHLLDRIKRRQISVDQLELLNNDASTLLVIVMHYVPGLRQGNAVSLLAVKRVRRSLQDDAWAKSTAAIVRHRFQFQCGSPVILDFRAQPAEKRADPGVVES